MLRETKDNTFGIITKYSLPSVLTDGANGSNKTRALAQNITIMSYVKIWVHLVFSTKDRIPFLTKAIKNDVYGHIIQNCKEKNIFLQSINGHDEHIHCLISLGKGQCISKVSQMIKGESSLWINRNTICRGKFAWQDDYFAVSVSESQVETVIQYIKNQETHHSKKTFAEEVDELMNKYGFRSMKA